MKGKIRSSVTASIPLEKMSRVLWNERSKIMRCWIFFHLFEKHPTMIDFKHTWKRQRGQKEPICGFGCATQVFILTSCVPSLATCPLLPFSFVCPHSFLIMQMRSRNSTSENENQGKTEDWTGTWGSFFVICHCTRQSFPVWLEDDSVWAWGWAKAWTVKAGEGPAFSSTFFPSSTHSCCTANVSVRYLKGFTYYTGFCYSKILD